MTFLGDTTFDDCCEPKPSKSEYGIDVLTRKMQGAADKLAAFLASLAQGQQLAGNPGFYLQTWTPDDNPVFPTVSMTYKGLIGGQLPPATGDDDLHLQTVTISTASPQKASREIQFWAFGTAWRYVANARVTTQQHAGPSANVDPVIFSSIIRKEGGGIYNGQAPLPLVTALTPQIVNVMSGLRTTKAVGTPYFEVEETILRTYKGD